MRCTDTQPRPPAHRLATGLLAIASLLFAWTGHAQAQQRKPPAPASPLWIDGRPGAARVDSRGGFATLAEQISPAVVNVIVTFRDTVSTGALGASPLQRERKGYGSGFIINPEGYALTNNHVVDGAAEIKVRLKDKREFRAYVIGTDPQTDVALIKIEGAQKFPTVALGNSDTIKVGDAVLAIGNPLGLNHTVTSGIISALGRKDLVPEGKTLYSEFIQTDASINPGNSGGPLIGLGGEVIGINTAINRQGQGIGFAIPINMIKTLLPRLKSSGYIVRSWLGIRVQEVTPLLARSFGHKGVRGALISEVISDSPAARSGMKAGDIILMFGDKKIVSSDQLPWLISTGGSDQDIKVTLWRKNARQTLTIKLAPLPNQERPTLPKPPAPRQAHPQDRTLGIKVSSLTQAMSRQLGLSDTQGVVITSVSDHSPALPSGLRERDVVVELGAEPVPSPGNFYERLERFKTGEVIRLKVARGGQLIFLAFER